MNYGAHLYVAYEAAPKIVADQMNEFGLGAMLPDLAAMNGSRIDHAALAGKQTALTRGVKFHQRTDSVFHGQPQFAQLRAEIQGDLEPLAQSSHLARGWSEVGIELFIDGLLFEDRRLRRRYHEALLLAKREFFAPKLGRLATPAFRAWLADYAEYDAPAYSDPPSIVRALHRCLATRDKRRGGSRVRLAFEEAQVRPVAAVFESHQDRIHSIGEELVKQTVIGLKNPEFKVVTIEPEDPAAIRARVPRRLRGDRRS